MTDRTTSDSPASERAWGFRTRALHAGGQPDPTTGARAVPIYQSTSFVFADVADAAALFALQKYGTIYSRISNPTTAAFEERMASLEGGIGAVATASGQAAEFLTAAALAESGTNFVTSSALYGGTYTMFDTTLGRFVSMLGSWTVMILTPLPPSSMMTPGFSTRR